MTFLPANTVLGPSNTDAATPVTVRLEARKKEFLLGRGFLSERDGFTLRALLWGELGPPPGVPYQVRFVFRALSLSFLSLALFVLVRLILCLRWWKVCGKHTKCRCHPPHASSSNARN